MEPCSLALCFNTKSQQRGSAPYPSFYGIVFLWTTDPVDLTLEVILEPAYYSCFLLKLPHCMEESSRLLGEVKEADITLAAQSCEITHWAEES